MLESPKNKGSFKDCLQIINSAQYVPILAFYIHPKCSTFIFTNNLNHYQSAGH